MAGPRLKWDEIVLQAAGIVRSYDTSVTLRQLFYRLVSAQVIPNSTNAYKQLSRTTAVARREGWFPDLIDNTRGIEEPAWWRGANRAVYAIKDQYRRDRTENQEFKIYIAVEKNALRTQLEHWFYEKGLPVLAFGGYPSQTFVNEIMEDIDKTEKPAILIYGGDFDPTGMDILRDFQARTAGKWEEVIRVALNEPQIAEFNLPPLPGKDWDSRAAGFEATYGEVIQVELDALPPETLKKIYADEVANWWDEDGFQESLKQEVIDREQIMMPDDVRRLLHGLATGRDLADVAAELKRKPTKAVVDQFVIDHDIMDELIAEFGEPFDVE